MAARILRGIFAIGLLLAILLLIVSSSIRLGSNGAYTVLPLWVYSLAPWGIAFIGALVSGTSSFMTGRRYSRFLTGFALIIVLLALASTIEGKLRLDQRVTQDWLRWTEQAAWLRPSANQFFHWDNFSLIGLLISILTISNTFTIIVYGNALSWSVPERYTPLALSTTITGIALGIALLLVLAAALHIIVTRCRELLRASHFLSNHSRWGKVLGDLWNRWQNSSVRLRVIRLVQYLRESKYSRGIGKLIQVLIALVIALDLFGVLLTWQVQEIKWDPIEPAGFPAGYPHSIQSILIEKGRNIIWVGTYEGGVFRSYENGKSWEAVNNNLITQHARVLVEGKDQNEILLGSPAGVYLWNESTDSWVDASTGLADTDIQALLFEQEGGTYFAGTAHGGLYRTQDLGSRWEKVESLAARDIRSIIRIPVQGELYVGTADAGVYRSVDHGTTWVTVNAGLNDHFVRSLLFDPRSRNIYAGTNNSGVFILDPQINRWKEINTGLDNLAVRSFAVFPTGKLVTATFGSGIFTSEDHGTSWKSSNPGIRDLKTRVVVFDPAEELLWAGTDEGGLFVSRDGGASWEAANAGLESISVQSVESFGNRLFSGTFGGGVFVTTDEGATWDIAGPGLQQAFINRLVYVPALGLLAGANNSRTSLYRPYASSWSSEPFFGLASAAGDSGNAILVTSGRLNVTHDWGRTWRELSTGLVGYNTTIYLPDQKAYLAGTNSNGVFRSADNGEAWEQSSVGLGLQSVRDFAFDRIHGRVYAINRTAAEGLYSSEDGGHTWSEIALPSALIPNPQIDPAGYQLSKIDIAPDGESLLLGTVGAGIWIRPKESENWRQANFGLQDRKIRDFAVDAGKNRIYAATDSAGVLSSADGGRTWWPTKAGVRDLYIRAIASGPNPGQLFAGTYGAGVYRSTDYGSTWEMCDGAMTDLDITSLLWSKNENLLFAGTTYGYIYRSRDFGDSWEEIQGLPYKPGTVADLRPKLQVSRDQQTIIVESYYGFYQSSDGGNTWEKSGIFYPENRIYGPDIRLAFLDGNLSFYKPGVGWLHLASYSAQVPEAVAIEGRKAILYASNGSSTLLKADIDLPLIWNTPVPYLRMVALSNWFLAQTLERKNPLLLGFGLAVLALASIAYAGVVRPNHLHPRTVVWLLRQPRKIFEAANYSRHVDRIRQNSALEQLILLLGTTRKPFTTPSMSEQLKTSGAVVERETLQAALLNLKRQGLLHGEDIDWNHSEPFLNEMYQRETDPQTLRALVRTNQETHPLFSIALRWLSRAYLRVTPVADGALYRAIPETDDILSMLPHGCFIKIFPGKTLDDQTVREFHSQVKSNDPSARVLLVILDRRPSDQGWAQIGTLRMAEFVVLPIESSLLSEALALGKEHDTLRNQLEGRLGANFNPFDVRDPVSGAFSFFGRDALVDNILRRMRNGRSIGLFGLRKMGKSSVLKALREQADFPIAFLNLQTVGREEIGEIFQRILRYWRDWIRVRYELDWAPPELSGKDPTGQYTIAVLSLLERLASRTSSPRLGILLDEIETIVPRKDGTGASVRRYLSLMRTLRGQIDEGLPLSLVVSSLNPSIIRINAWENEQNPMYNFFQEEYLGPLEPDHCMQMVTNLGQQIRMGFDDRVLGDITLLSGGHPFLARQICSVLFTQARPFPNVIQSNMLGQAIDQFIRDESTIVHLDAGLFQEAGNANLWDQESSLLNQQILMELARSLHPLKLDEFHLEVNRDSLMSALYNLQRYHFVYQPESDRYALQFELLRVWLRKRKLGLEYEL